MNSMISIRKVAICGSISLFSLFSGSAIAEESQRHEGFYMMTGLGYTNTTNIDIVSGGSIVFENGVLYDVGAGYDFGSIRAEISYDGTTQNIASVQGYKAYTQVKTNSIYATGYYDFRSDKKWQPYLGIGLGSSAIDTSTAYVGNITLNAGTTNIFSAIVKAGLTYSTGTSDIFIERSGQGFDNFTIGSFEYTGVGVGSWTAGLRFKF